jgi:hypothetical protein
MLSSLKPANGKFVLGPAVETTPPTVVFTGPADHPDPVIAQTASATPKKKKKTAAKGEGTENSKGAEKPASGAAAEKPKKAGDAKPAKAAKPAKQSKPKVTSSTQ